MIENRDVGTNGDIHRRKHASRGKNVKINFICDIIKRNESDVGYVVFEILAKIVFKFLYFILFLALSNPF